MLISGDKERLPAHEANTSQAVAPSQTDTDWETQS